MMEGLLKRLDDVAYMVSDWQRAKQFYGQTLGLPVAAFISDEVGWMEFGEKDQTHLAINLWREVGPVPAGGNGGVAVFMVENARQAVEELRRRGVRCDDPIEVPNMIIYANIYDPDGNKIQLAQSVM